MRFTLILLCAFEPFTPPRSGEDVAALRLTIIEHVAKDMTEAELFVPYKNHGVIAALHEHAQVLRETHEDEGTRIVVRAPEELLERLRGQLAGG